MIQKYKVEGMSCGGCAHNVEEILSKIDGVILAKVDLSNKTASVETKQHIGMDTFNKAFMDTKFEIEEVS